MISFTIFPSSGKHCTKKNTLIASRGRVRNADHTKAAQLDYHRQARAAYVEQTPHFSDVPYELHLCFFFPLTPKAIKDGIQQMDPYMARIDTLNLAALVHDALQGVCYDDDSQIAFSSERKIWGKRCGVFVLLRRIDETPAFMWSEP